MKSLNRITILGRLGDDPKLYQTDYGTIARLSVATSYAVKRNGEWVENTDWHRVVITGKSAENLHLTKGQLVYIEGRMKYSQWTDKDGQTKQSADIVASGIIGMSSHVAPSGEIPF